MNNNRSNNLIGWAIFVLSLIVYLFTLEPTVSLWDCGEFIAASWYLQIGHPPGAPFFIMLARLAGLLAPSTDKVALFMNGVSAVASAATVMFLYWTIVRLASRIFSASETRWALFAAGAIGALSFAFTDTFWFSAVETEVYALSSLFTAVVFWAVLRWKAESDGSHADRWLLLIAYLIGLSIGVHLLNLLAIPAIVLMWYFKKSKKYSAKGIILALAASFLIIACIMWGIIQGTPILAGKMEVAVVNGLGLPYNSGFILFFVLLFLLFAFFVWYSHKKNKPWLNAIALSAIFIYMGYGSYATMMIRSAANPPLDENDPKNSYSLTRYLNREQYGKTPLITGYYFDAPVVGAKKGAPIYYPKNGKYELIDGDVDYLYDDRFKTFFPRMYSSSSQHVQGYSVWAEIDGEKITVDKETMVIPTFGENLRFFFNYQLRHMYFRYFMWNFSGRQNDNPGHGDIFNGNWITGISFIDKANLGHNGFQPKSMANPESTNKYFMLPLLLGLIGLFFHANRKKTDFWVVFSLFIMTGVAIVVYLNQTPYQPRERDYAYAGSFYAFSIWIGIGLLPVFEILKSRLKTKYATILATAVTLIVPVLLFSENYDDHDRSERFFVREMARNYLNSCADHAVLFTYADNDTFPLWYLQDVEKERRDVRICNVTLLGMDWYIDQMKHKVYDSDPLPVNMPKEKYEHNKRNVVLVRSDVKKPIDIDLSLKIATSDDPQYMLTTTSDEKYNFFPSNLLKINVDKVQVLKTKTVKPELASQIEDSIIIRLKGNYISKSDLAIIDMLANNNWERPIYFDSSVLQTISLDLSPYLQFEGLACRFVPIKTEPQPSRPGRIDTEILYDRLINTFKWGGLENPSILIDYNLKYTVEVIQLKIMYLRLAEQLLAENKSDLAIETLEHLYKALPLNLYSTNYVDMMNAKLYYIADHHYNGDELLQRCADDCLSQIDFYLNLTRGQKQGAKEIESNGALLKEMISIADAAGRNELSQGLQDQLNALLSDFE